MAVDKIMTVVVKQHETVYTQLYVSVSDGTLILQGS